MAAKNLKIDVKTLGGKTDGSVELPAELTRPPTSVDAPGGDRNSRLLPGRARIRRRRGEVRAVAAESHTGRRKWAAPVRLDVRAAVHGRWCRTVPNRVTTASAP